MILVTGGTGLVGAHLLYNLALKNDQIKAIRRESSNTAKTRKVFSYYSDPDTANRLFEKIQWVSADLNDIPALSLAFNDVTEIYHCAALISFDPSDEKEMRKVNITGTANIVNLCISNQVTNLCYVSSVATIGAGREPNENSKWNPEDDHSDYAISKYGAEIEVWRGSQEGINVIIVNPGIIIGPGFWNEGSGKIFSRIDRGLHYHFPKVSGFIGVQDVVSAMESLMQMGVKNENFILVAENLSFKEVFQLTASNLGKEPPKHELKKWMVSIGWLFQKLAGLFGAKREITRDSIDGLYKKTFYDNSKIKKSLDFDFTPIDKVIQETSSIYKKESLKD